MNGCSVDLRVQHIVEVVRVSLSDSSLTVVRLAHEVHLSPSRLRELFHNQLGQSPKQYVLSKRLTQAAALLSTSFYSVKEVMTRVGMSDPRNFTREFKRLFGESPTRYRKHHSGVASAE